MEAEVKLNAGTYGALIGTNKTGGRWEAAEHVSVRGGGGGGSGGRSSSRATRAASWRRLRSSQPRWRSGTTRKGNSAAGRQGGKRAKYVVEVPIPL